jgi:hypothetical protein
MRKSFLLLLLSFLLIVGTNQQSPLGNMSEKFRRAAPSAFPGLGSYVLGPRSFGYYEEASFERDDINAFTEKSRTFSISQGTARLLRGWMGSRFLRHRRPAVPVDPFGGASISFKPWHGIAALKFGNSYSHISLDSHMRFPGVTWVKASGIVAIRQNSTIHTKVGYGWVAGLGKQFFTSTTVRKCRRTLFWSRCWTESIAIPRGVNANELHSVSDGMNHLLFNKIADVSGARLLRLTSTSLANQKGELNLPFIPNRQILTGVSGSKILGAISAIIGKKTKFSPLKLISGKSVRLDAMIITATKEIGETFTLTFASQ